MYESTYMYLGGLELKYIRLCVCVYVYIYIYLFIYIYISHFVSNTINGVKREYRQDAKIQMFIVKFRCLLSTTVSTCFGHHYTHHQENKDRILLRMVFAL